jgi:two-component system, sensor histidine kinase
MAASADRNDEPSQSLTGMRVVVVEDTPDARDMLETLLAMHGVDVHVRPDGRSGLAAIRALRPHVAFVDLGLPALDGIALARALRAQAEGAATLLVALTGYSEARDREAAASAGFDVFLNKPAAPDALIELLAEHAARLAL